MDKPAAQAIRMKVAILGGKGPGAPVLAPPPTEAAWKLMVLPFPFSLAVAVDGFALCRWPIPQDGSLPDGRRA